MSGLQIEALFLIRATGSQISASKAFREHKLGCSIKINQKICLIDKLGHKKDTSWLKKRGRSIFATSGISEFLIRTKSTLISHLFITFKKILGKNQLTAFIVDYDKINYRDSA